MGTIHSSAHNETTKTKTRSSKMNANNAHANAYIANLIATSRIVIAAGEGDVLTKRDYTGKRTMRAIKMALTKERCGGDRNAKCFVMDGDAELDIDTMQYR